MLIGDSIIIYSEINVFCFIILFILLTRFFSSIDKGNLNKIFVAIIICSMLFWVSDLLWGYTATGYVKFTDQEKYRVNYLYFTACGAVSYLWFLYSETVQDSIFVNKKFVKILSAIPFISTVIFTVLSQKTHCFFYIEKGIYYRGSFYVLQECLIFIYVIFTSLKALVLSLKKENFVRQKELATLASFVVMPIAAGILQGVFPGYPMLCMGITLGILQVYLSKQELLISKDPLTQLPNRREFIRHLSVMISHKGDNKRLFLFLMDADYFKKINDAYGHVEGDKALTIIGNTLDKVAKVTNSFAARYGGDEFVFLYEESDDLLIYSGKSGETRIRELIQIRLAENVKRHHLPYDLTMSIGIAEYSKAMKTIPDFIAKADKELYKIKQSRKTERA